MTKPLLREEEVSDGINVIVDDRFVAMFPMASRAQVTHLIEAVNLAVRQKLDRSYGAGNFWKPTADGFCLVRQP